MDRFSDNEKKIYTTPSSPTLISHIKKGYNRILDVGSGVGNHGILIKNKFPNIQVDSITISPEEQKICSKIYNNSYLLDIEKDSLEIIGYKYDLIIFSHVLEHTSYPKKVLAKFHGLLNTEGACFIVVPNFLHYINRTKILFGKLDYTKEGIMDYTHLRIFSYKNALPLLIDDSLFVLKTHSPRGLHPNTVLSNILGTKNTKIIDRFTLKISPGLFAEEFILFLTKK